MVIISLRFREEQGCCVFKEEEREAFLTVRGVSKGLDNRRGDSCCCSSYCIVYILIRGLVVKTLIIIVYLLPMVGRTLDVSRLAEPTFGEGALTNRPPLFAGENYAFSKIRMQIFLESVDKGVWTQDENRRAPYDVNTRNVIALLLTMDEFFRISQCKTAKEMWEVLEVTHEGTNEVMRARKNSLIQEYELFRMKARETTYEVQKRFTDIVNHLMTLEKMFDKEEINIKILKSLNRSCMNMATLFGKLRGHQLEFGRLKEEEEIEEKKSIALKATSKKATKNFEPEVDSKTELHNKEIMNMVERKVQEPMLSNVMRVEEKGTSNQIENSDSDSSSDEDCSIEQESNIYFMAGSAQTDYDNDEEFQSELIEVKYDMLLDAFQEIHAEAIEDEAQSKFLDCWKIRNLTTHKFLKLSFFKNEGTLCSKVKGIDIKLTNEIWSEIAGLKLGGERCHLGMEGFHKFSDIQDYSHYKTGGMKKDDRLAVFVISWILMPRGSNHAQATTEDLYLLKALKENIQVH
ncbi:hypothetical protein V8G54_031821 [Vigna mungo]|uniref:Uncharacterized protein n=1 Tax=Vigna mungo TaxID=3915 RepID=A0AAQ3REV4_VIGMU